MASLVAGETLRILLIGAREEARDEVIDALDKRLGDYRLHYVSQPDLAAARAEDLFPQVILLDDALADTDLAALVKRLVNRVPYAAIVFMVDSGSLDKARQAVLLGARGFVVKPLDPEELASSIQQVVGQRPVSPAGPGEIGRPMGRTVVFCAPRGGTGRTTLAINTAIALRGTTEGPIALVDADYSAPAIDVSLNLQGYRTVADLLPRLARLDQDLISGVMAPHTSGVDVLLAPPPADLAHPISLPQVQQILVLLKRMFPWVLVDLGLPMDETAFAFLDGADRIVMSVLPEMVGLRNTRLMLDQLHERGYPGERVWLVLNRASMSGAISSDDIEERLRVKVTYQISDDQSLATHAVNRGVPLMMSHRRSALGRSFQGFARQLAEEMPVEQVWMDTNAQKDGSLLQRLMGRRRPTGA